MNLVILCTFVAYVALFCIFLCLMTGLGYKISKDEKEGTGKNNVF